MLLDMLWRNTIRERVNNVSRWLNLDLCNYEGEGEYNIPVIYPVNNCDAINWMGFNRCLSDRKSSRKKLQTGVHFFLSDGEFERCWKDPNRYGEMLRAYNCAFSPDFSMFTSFPKAMQIWNHYRKHWLARYWQDMGLTIIPTISWSDESSFEWCFDGEPKHSVVAVSNIGCVRSPKNHKAFLRGYNEMLKRLEPSLIFVYAHKIYDYPGNVKFIHFSMDKKREVI